MARPEVAVVLGKVPATTLVRVEERVSVARMANKGTDRHKRHQPPPSGFLVQPVVIGTTCGKRPGTQKLWPARMPTSQPATRSY